MAIDYTISDAELQMQIALGTADIAYLNIAFIASRNNPETIEALATMWAKTGMNKRATLDIADALIAHPHVSYKTRSYVMNLRNRYLYVFHRVSAMYVEITSILPYHQQRLRKLREL